MIVFVQPFGLRSPGGGPRILRALLADAPVPFLSICSWLQAPPISDVGRELHVPMRPWFGRVETTRPGRYLGLLLPLFSNQFKSRLERICCEEGARAIHAIPHGLDFWYAFQVAQKLEIPYYLNVHDDLRYNLRGRPEMRAAIRRLGEVWTKAAHCFVISESMGRECCLRYGERPYTIITDGLTDLPDGPRPLPAKSLRVYFGGAIHESYRPNFRCLLRALEILRRKLPDTAITMTCRGSAAIEGGDFPVRVLPWASEAAVARDLEEVDLLYLPLPFDRKYEPFYRFSLSTKLVTYLGSGLPILFHGPPNSALGELLSQHQAGILLGSLDPARVADSLLETRDRTEIVRNALELGRRRFWLADQRRRFWSWLAPGVAMVERSDDLRGDQLAGSDSPAGDRAARPRPGMRHGDARA
jgi:hypothetical protein